MAFYRCHFLDAHDHISSHEEIDAGSFFDAFNEAMRCSIRGRTTTPSSFGPATNGSTVPGGTRAITRPASISLAEYQPAPCSPKTLICVRSDASGDVRFSRRREVPVTAVTNRLSRYQ